MNMENKKFTKEDIEYFEQYISNVFPTLDKYTSKGYGSSYPFNLSYICYTLDLPEIHDEWEIIRIYEDNAVSIDKSLYRRNKFRIADSWSDIPIYKDHKDLDFICKCVTQLSSDHKRFKLETKLKEIKHDFR
jgi:hypothetical protein